MFCYELNCNAAPITEKW